MLSLCVLLSFNKTVLQHCCCCYRCCMFLLSYLPLHLLLLLLFFIYCQLLLFLLLLLYVPAAIILYAGVNFTPLLPGRGRIIVNGSILRFSPTDIIGAGQNPHTGEYRCSVCREDVCNSSFTTLFLVGSPPGILDGGMCTTCRMTCMDAKILWKLYNGHTGTPRII